MRAVTFPCSGSAAEARARLEAAIDGRPWNAAGLDGWIRGDGVVLYYRDAAKYRAIFRPRSSGDSASATARRCSTAASG